MQKLETNFRDGGFDYTIVEREGDVVLAGEVRDGKIRGYIVFHLLRFADRVIMGNFSPAKESVPSPESWGDEGWTFSGGPVEVQLAAAFERFVERVTIRRDSPLIEDAPSGRPRGRERNAFELDLSPMVGDFFEFAQVRTQYPEVDEPMLRNRLKTALDTGKVRFVKEVPGGRGKPRKFYEVVS